MKTMKQWKRSLALGLLAITLAGSRSQLLSASPLDQIPASDSMTYRLADTWADVPWEPEAGRYGWVWDISSAPDGTIYVLDGLHKQLHRLRPDGTPFQLVDLAAIGIDRPNRWAERLDVGPDGNPYLLVRAKDGSWSVDRLTAGGQLVGQVDLDPAEVPGARHSLQVEDLAVGPDQRLYLAATGFDSRGNEGRIEVRDPRGGLVDLLGTAALDSPLALDVSADGTLYVVNRLQYPVAPDRPGPEPTPRPSRLGADAPTDGAEPVDGVVIFGADGVHRETVPFVGALDVAVGPAGVFVSREAEIYPLRESEPIYAGPGGLFTRMTLDVPADGRVLGGWNDCNFQGLVEFADPAGRPAAARLVGALDYQPLEGPIYPLRIAASDEVAVLSGQFDRIQGAQDWLAASSLMQSGPQNVQRWLRHGLPAGDRRLRSQLGLCGWAGWPDNAPTVDVAIAGRDIYTVGHDLIGRRSDDGLPAWTVHADALADFSTRVYPIAVSADRDSVAVLGGDGRVYLLDAAGNLKAGWPISAAGGAVLAGDIALGEEPRRIYLADQGAGRVLVRGLDGADLGAWPTHDGPKRLATGPSGDVFVLGRGGWGYRYRPDGALVTAWPMPEPLGPHAGGSRRSLDALDIAVDVDGRVYVSFMESVGPDRVTANAGLHIVRAGVWVFDELTGPKQPPVVSAPGACIARPDKRADPQRIELGAGVEVTLEAVGWCPGAFDPVQIALVLDTSRSMNFGDTLDRAKDAVLTLLGELDPSVAEVALVTFDDSAALVAPLMSDIGAVAERVVGLTASGDTRLAAGLAVARAELGGSRQTPSARQVILVITDDGFTDEPEAEIESARAAGIEIDALVISSEWVFDSADPGELAWLLGDRSRVIYDPDENSLRRFARELAGFHAQDGLFETVTVEDEIPANMRYVPGSAQPPAVFDAARRTLTWTLSDIQAADGLTLRYRLIPTAVGTWPTNVQATADYRDALGNPGRLVFPIPQVEVTGTAYRAYLPFAAAEACFRPSRPLDAVLVIDTSNSMAEPDAGGGRTRLQAAQAAAQAFVDLASLPTDQVAVVAFNQAGTRVAELSGDRARVREALAGLATAPGTRIDLGLAETVGALTDGRRPEAQPVAILLTDGLQNQAEAPNAAVLAQADRLKAAGALVYTIGLGGDIDHALLGAVASTPDRAYTSPTAAELETIYRAISARLWCEVR
jgi:Mg-chelatase subunit ChlD